MTSQHSKHPDWDEVCEKLQTHDLSWLCDYIKSHDINQCTDEQGNTLVHYAAQCNNENYISYSSYLLVDPNIKNAAGRTALQCARDAQANSIRYLHEYHLCIDFDKASSEPNGLDALFAAIYRGDATLGDTSGVKDDGNEKNTGQWTALRCAAMYNRPQIIRALHQRFPNLNADDSASVAAKHGHSNCLIALRDCFPSIQGGDALQAACHYNHPTCIPTLQLCFPGNALTENHDHCKALISAVLYENPECVRTLHSCFPGLDPNWQTEDGETALMSAVWGGGTRNFHCISVLSECFPNIDPNKTEKCYGHTALMYACNQNQPNGITALATHFPNIDVNIRNFLFETALTMVMDDGNEQCFITLCESFPDIDPNVTDDVGNSALMREISSTEPEIFVMSELLRLFPNIDPNLQNEDSETTLIFMARYDCPVEITRQFLDLFPNVDVTLQDDQGQTAFGAAIIEGNVPMIDLLLERFPDIYSHTTTKRRTTALMLAIQEDQLDALTTLLQFIIQID